MKCNINKFNVTEAVKPKKRKHRFLALIIVASSFVTVCCTLFVLCKFVLPKFAFYFEPDGDEEEEGEENTEERAESTEA